MPDNYIIIHLMQSNSSQNTVQEVLEVTKVKPFSFSNHFIFKTKMMSSVLVSLPVEYTVVFQRLHDMSPRL